jgi:hypothetical protein
MLLLAGRGAWPSALSRARSLSLSVRSVRPLTGEAGASGAGFQQEGQQTGLLSRIRVRSKRAQPLRVSSRDIGMTACYR